MTESADTWTARDPGGATIAAVEDTPNSRRSGRSVAALAVSSLLFMACSSAAVDDNTNDDPANDTGSVLDGDSNPDNQDTVVPPDSVGVGGGVPVDNLDPNVEPGADDTDGDGAPDG